MKYINVFDNEAAYNAVKDSLARPQLAMEKSGGKIFNLSETVTPTIEYVDLGLSVKWATYNLGATHGDTSISWYGNYYAWGETNTKASYDISTYSMYTSHWDSEEGGQVIDTITKYNTDEEYGTVDGKTTLESSDDIIAATYGGSWRMPTKAELDELVELHNDWVTDYNGITGLNGRTFTGNGNTLFVPAGGFFDGSVLGDTGDYGVLWAGSLSSGTPKYAYILGCFSEEVFVGDDYRYYGLTVRSVCPKS